jgi:lipopolysaccharide export LptBFGC system permease protein LptF
MTEPHRSFAAQLGAGRERRRLDQARLDVRLSDADVRSLLGQAGELLSRPAEQPPADQAERQKWEEELRAQAEQAFQSFRDEVLNREIDAYLKGADAVTNQAARTAYNTRSLVLLLVVLAVVVMPLIAMANGLNPQSFGAYIAPVTGIAGTVVGYWFGTVERRPGARD